MTRDPAIEDWVERARRADIWAVLNRVAPGHAVKRRGRRGVGPCPACGGKDRFSIDGGKGLFFCRKSRTGGDAIALVEYLTGANFLGAVEEVTGDPMPARSPRDEIRRADPKLVEQRRLDAEAEAQRRAAEANAFRDKEIARAAAIWAEGLPLDGFTPADSYLRLRGVQPPPGARLRCHTGLKYWHHVEGDWRVIHQGPALLARIDDGDHHFIGCHCTYIDLASPKGKAAPVDPVTGEVLDAKKVRGAQKGGHIHLGGDPARASRLVMGEGIETTLSAREALVWAGRDMSALLFWAGVNLYNIGGPSAGSVIHPTLTRTDARGRVRRAKVPGPVPDMDSADPVLLPPARVGEATLLGDSDSDRFTTTQNLLRAAARWAARGTRTAVAWPPAGEDFNDMIREKVMA